MKLIVTGANGFIGKHLCKRLKAEKWDFTCLVRSESSATFFEENDIPTIPMDGDVQYLAEIFKKKK
jgi:nucleoside-diphosphate-sugar epimerase